MTIIQEWAHPVVIAENNFIYKSLSNWSCNTAVGCTHACRFCFVPSTSTNKMGKQLKALGVNDPDEEWGDYAFIRPWDQKAFMSSLKKAQKKPLHELKPDGNRAVMFCTTTDPYQVAGKMTQTNMELMKNCLLRIRDNSDLNVRILTRSPLARMHFELFKSFGKRLMFGMSIPTLRNSLAKIYEPKAPAPTVRLKTLQEARDYGLNIYVAMAPTYPECDKLDLLETYTRLMACEPKTIFHEPINIRAENVARIQKHAEEIGERVNTEVFQTVDSWMTYAFRQLQRMEDIAGHFDKSPLHLWPDKSLAGHVDQLWLDKWWNRISEWPK